MKTQKINYYKQVVLFSILLAIPLSVYTQNSVTSNHKLGVSAGYRLNNFSNNSFGTDDISLNLNQTPDLSFSIEYYYLLENSNININFGCGFVTNSFIAKYDFINPHPDDDMLLQYHKIYTIKPDLHIGSSYIIFKNEKICVTQGLSIDWLYFNPLKSNYDSEFFENFDFSKTVLMRENLDGLKFDIYDVNRIFDNNFYAMIETRVFFFYRKPFSFVIQPYVTTNFDFLNKDKVISAYQFSYGINIGVIYNFKKHKK
ncbi:MAG: hypothetical protein ACP5DZ_11270 [Bacteroidales bacterium]